MRSIAGTAAGVALLAAHPASASSCVSPKTVPIVFAKGARCWTYQGDATHFTGTFMRGQRVVVSSTGIASYGDGAWEWRRTERRDLAVNGPGQRFIEIDDEGDGDFTVPVAGRYTFSFSPCAMWHQSGTFVVCAR